MPMTDSGHWNCCIVSFLAWVFAFSFLWISEMPKWCIDYQQSPVYWECFDSSRSTSSGIYAIMGWCIQYSALHFSIQHWLAVIENFIWFVPNVFIQNLSITQLNSIVFSLKDCFVWAKVLVFTDAISRRSQNHFNLIFLIGVWKINWNWILQDPVPSHVLMQLVQNLLTLNFLNPFYPLPMVRIVIRYQMSKKNS